MALPASINHNDMRNMVNHFPELLTSLKLDDYVVDELKSYIDDGVEGICFLGMGGSSIVGGYVKSLLRDRISIEIVVIRDYTIPAFVTSKWIIIAVSYSGNTEETITALSIAKTIGARIITMASGGLMAENEYDLQINLPKGVQPRAALPLMFSIALNIVEILTGLPTTNFANLSKMLSQNAAAWNEKIESPRDLATSLMNRIPLFIGAQHLIPVAYRAKCQINENSKALAFHSEIPESNHNEIESFNLSHDCRLIPIFLRSMFESENLSRRFNITENIYQELGLKTICLSIGGETLLEEMLGFTHFLDMVSVEYAEQLGVNPVSVEKIEDLKRRLKET